MEQRLVGYFDFLGFRSALKGADEEREGRILHILTQLARATTDASYRRTDNGDRTSHSIRPAFTAFSDNIVYSHPASHVDAVGMGPVCIALAQDAARVFSQAITIGCLVRGGIAIGKMHHEGGVAFGPAFVEAYELESQFANTPRIILSKLASERIPQHPYVSTDMDGFSTLNYVRAAYDQIPSGPPGVSEQWADKRAWIAMVQRVCAQQIAAMEDTSNLHGLSKWRWFSSYFEAFVAGLHPSITGRSLVPQ